jgi:hypothetical protein
MTVAPLRKFFRNRITWSVCHCLAWIVVSASIWKKEGWGPLFFGAFVIFVISAVILWIDIGGWQGSQG